MQNLNIDGDRLWESLMELAQIGATEKGGVCRLALTDLDREGRDLFIRWCEAAGCTVSVDRVGNVFARRPGRDESRPPVMTGSHLDSQPTGGKFDGAYGVLAGLEVIRTLNDLEIETDAPVEVVAWTNEEGSRFSPPMMGSGAFAGVFSEAEMLARPDNVTGDLLGDELKRIGYDGAAPVGGREIGAYFEAHIEQGPILENEEKTIGVVTGAQGQHWYEITVTGQEAHAGPTPMPLRKDALVAAARMIDAVNRLGHAFPPNACATVGFVDSSPNSRNTIPGKVFFTVDLRHPDDDTLAAMNDRLRAEFAGNRRGRRLQRRDRRFLGVSGHAVRRGLRQRRAQRRRAGRPQLARHRLRRRPRRRLHRPGRPGRHDLHPVRGRHQPQRDRERHPRRLRRRRPGAAPGDAGTGRWEKRIDCNAIAAYIRICSRR